MTGFLLVFALHSDGRYDDEFLSNYAYINLQNQLLKINGVGKVSIMGAGEYAMRVWLKPDRAELLRRAGFGRSARRHRTSGGRHLPCRTSSAPSQSPDGTSYTYTVTMPPPDHHGRAVRGDIVVDDHL
ncbi:MAG: efflux RND transporter permease subunit [Alistipes finegoldii]